MAKKTANVSIIAANYNNGIYLEDFINSVNESTLLPKELLIVNDGSTDDSLKILENFSGLSYLKIINFERNRGFCIALNEGIKNAKGKYIMRVDPDDIILKNRIATQVNFLDKNKEIDVVGSNVIYFNSQTKKEICKSNFPTEHQVIWSTYYKGEHGVQHPSTMIRSKVIKKYKYVQENFKAEDFEIFAHMINDGYRFANISEPLTKMRIHKESVSSNIRYNTIKLTYKIRDEIFGTSSSIIKMRFYYWHILNYKKFLITQNFLVRPMYLALAIICHPLKLIRKAF